MAEPRQTGQQLAVDEDGNITTLAPPLPAVPDQTAPVLDDETAVEVTDLAEVDAAETGDEQ